MDDLCWEVFKMTGSIDAYLYINEYNNVYGNKEDMRETSKDDDNFEYPGDST
ncbi:YqzL family protein [Clostridioides mangenotii]|uniref:YqzL family protein n=1 Tax=Metaclostridioides mangenotii TaxID=1540 RepID=UPI001C10970F|nr:YqzL family protein [Clostridioides mangenotii]MBU5307713.1 YqzL family protein [Clostridioides mangenotii]MCR1954834.1 YqzL family protein [Clostridioides mangenotii]